MHIIDMVCTDYFAPDRRWVAMCRCGKYKSDRLPTPEDAAARALTHVKAKSRRSA